MLRTCISILIAVSLAGMPSAGRAAAAGESPAGVIPSVRCRGLWIVPITIADRDDLNLRMVLDTGAWRTYIDPDAIRRLTGRSVRAGKAKLRNVSIGPVRLEKIPAVVHEIDHISRALGMEIDGILGFPVFKSLLLTFDYPGNEIRVSSGRLDRPDGQAIFKDVGKYRPWLALDLDGRRRKILLDTGSSWSLDLDDSDVSAWIDPPRPTGGAVVFNGIKTVSHGRADLSFRFGPLPIDDPVLRVSDGSPLAGAKLLERFILTFDQRSNRIRMVADSDDPVRFDSPRGYGAIFRPLEAGWEIAGVIPGGPAEAVGLRKGDLVIAIDGMPIAEQGCERPTADPDRHSAMFTVRRQGEADFEVEVPIVTFLPDRQAASSGGD